VKAVVCVNAVITDGISD